MQNILRRLPLNRFPFLLLTCQKSFMTVLLVLVRCADFRLPPGRRKLCAHFFFSLCVSLLKNLHRPLREAQTCVILFYTLALVAQLDRALDSDSKGRWFESSQAHQKICAEIHTMKHMGWEEAYFLQREQPNVAAPFYIWGISGQSVNRKGARRARKRLNAPEESPRMHRNRLVSRKSLSFLKI